VHYFADAGLISVPSMIDSLLPATSVSRSVDQTNVVRANVMIAKTVGRLDERARS
jgi:hypothetical protein